MLFQQRVNKMCSQQALQQACSQVVTMLFQQLVNKVYWKSVRSKLVNKL